MDPSYCILKTDGDISVKGWKGSARLHFCEKIPVPKNFDEKTEMKKRQRGTINDQYTYPVRERKGRRKENLQNVGKAY